MIKSSSNIKLENNGLAIFLDMDLYQIKVNIEIFLSFLLNESKENS